MQEALKWYPPDESPETDTAHELADVTQAQIYVVNTHIDATPSLAAQANVHISVMAVLGFIAASALWLQDIGLMLYLFLPLQFLTCLPIILGAGRLLRYQSVPIKPLQHALLPDNELPVYSILIPLYQEANMIPQIAATLARLDYPADKLDVLILLEHDDTETQMAIWRTPLPSFCRSLIVPQSDIRTKPHACNYGLLHARGDYLVIYDAEDKPHAQQLRAAATYFRHQPLPVACLQSPLDIAHPEGGHRDWLHQQFAFEYRLLFNLVLPILTRARLAIPLGGTSNHFRIAVLRALGGWDACNLTEDADLGYRLAQHGYQIRMLPYPTLENAPHCYRTWFRQRTRWLSGHIQTWHVHMRTPLHHRQQMGWANFSAMNLILGMRLLIGPVHCTFAIWFIYQLMFAPATLHITASAIFTLIFYASVSGAVFALMRDYSFANRLRLIIALPFYWMLIAPPTLYACWRMVRRNYGWLKSSHVPYAQMPHIPKLWSG